MNVIPYAKNEATRKRRILIILFCIIVIIILCTKFSGRNQLADNAPLEDNLDSSQDLHHDLVIPNTIANKIQTIGKVVSETVKSKQEIEDEEIERQLIEQENVLLIEASKNAKNEKAGTFFDENGNELGLRFLVVSDCGGKGESPYVTHAQMNLARAMDYFASSYDASFILSLGDNFSPAGIKDLNDIRFQDTFEDAFAGRGLQIPWYIIAGNDDYKGNISAELSYSKISKRWNFYRLNYMLSAKLSTYSNISVDIIMIDTVQLCGRLPSNGLVTPIGPDDKIEAEKTWKWIENKLHSSKAEYLFVAGHYPVYSGGKHGSTQCLIERLQPLLERYRVSAYMSGHDHSLQHIKSPGEGGVHYFVNGASSPDEDRLQHMDTVYKNSRYYWTNHLDKSQGAFMYCDIRKDEMKVDFINSKKKVLHTAVVYPRNHPANQKDTKEEDDIHEIPVVEKHPKAPPSSKFVENQIEKETNKHKHGYLFTHFKNQ